MAWRTDAGKGELKSRLDHFNVATTDEETADAIKIWSRKIHRLAVLGTLNGKRVSTITCEAGQTAATRQSQNGTTSASGCELQLKTEKQKNK